MDIARAHVLIEGRVQGVFYRSSTCSEANSLGINGWVKNCTDGRVEAIFEGDAEKVRKMVTWCYKGPPYASVKDVKVVWEKPDGKFSDFSIRY